MIKIEFSGLTFFPDANYKEVTNVNYRYIPIDDLVVNNSANWNGETQIIQSIFYDAFKISFMVRENQKQGFQKIAYAPTIKVINTDNSKEINAKFISVEFERIESLKEFYFCEFSFADLDTKTVQNNITSSENYSLIFNDAGSPVATFLTKFEPIQKPEYSEAVKSDFKDKIINYNKIRYIYSLLLYMSESELSNFLDKYKTISNSDATYFMQLKDPNSVSIVTNIKQSILQETNYLSNDLFSVKLDLISSNTITAPNN